MNDRSHHYTRRAMLCGTAGAIGGLTLGSRASLADPPEIVGRWSPTKYAWPDVAIHLHLLPSSDEKKARLFSYSDDGVPGLKDRNAGFSKSYIVEIPTMGVPQPSPWLYVPNNSTNLFCSGHTLLPDGRLLAMGGHVDLNFYGAGDINFFSESPTPAWRRKSTP